MACLVEAKLCVVLCLEGVKCHHDVKDILSHAIRMCVLKLLLKLNNNWLWISSSVVRLIKMRKQGDKVGSNLLLTSALG